METIEGGVYSIYVYLSVVIPLKYSVLKFKRHLKGKSTLMIDDRHSELQSTWDKSF